MSTKMMMKIMLCVVAVFAVVSSASAFSCRYNDGGIECCQVAVGPGVLHCKKCESGSGLARGGRSCIIKGGGSSPSPKPSRKCPPGSGPGQYGDANRCFDCTAENCARCDGVFTTCSSCYPGYKYDADNDRCFNVQGMGSPDN